jgi:site-specific DNA recombinase
VIVVYKVDRLSRSLSDFAKMVDVFDEFGVSFVSVTQQFNTTTSMGRLTLNVLLSFAQFEREVTAERIRDKIAASKKKGLWMGGVVPLGYDVLERRLVVNEQEAETIRALFDLYLKLGSVAGVAERAQGRGFTTKIRRSKEDELVGGRPLSRGHIYKILANPVYIGKIVHRGACHEGLHAAIIDQATWDAVRDRMEQKTVRRDQNKNLPTVSLLSGLLVDEQGKRLSVSHANKGTKRYRYYVQRKTESDVDGNRRWWLPAQEAERIVIDALTSLLQDPASLSRSLDVSDAKVTTTRSLLDKAKALAENLRDMEPIEKQRFLAATVNRVEVSESGLRILIDRTGLARCLDGSDSQGGLCEPRQGADLFSIHVDCELRRCGGAVRLVLRDGSSDLGKADLGLIELIERAHVAFASLRTGEKPLKQLAAEQGMDRADFGRLIRLAFLSPDITEAIRLGEHPVHLCVTSLRRLKNLPLSWEEQRQVLGFSTK